MIATRTEIKSILQISNTTYDTLIDILIPLCVQEIFNITNNYFIDENIQYNSNTFTFSSSALTVVDSNSKFFDYDFAGVTDINIQDSKYNNNNYKISTITASTITLDSQHSLINEDEENNIYISRVIYPSEIKLILAYMINHKISKDSLKQASGIKSEKIDDYQIQYEDGITGYPQPINSSLARYKRVRWN